MRKDQRASRATIRSRPRGGPRGDLSDPSDDPLTDLEISELATRAATAISADLVEFLEIIGTADVTDQEQYFPMIEWLDEHYWLPPERAPSEYDEDDQVGGYPDEEWQKVLAKHAKRVAMLNRAIVIMSNEGMYDSFAYDPTDSLVFSIEDDGELSFKESIRKWLVKNLGEWS